MNPVEAQLQWGFDGAAVNWCFSRQNTGLHWKSIKVTAEELFFIMRVFSASVHCSVCGWGRETKLSAGWHRTLPSVSVLERTLLDVSASTFFFWSFVQFYHSPLLFWSLDLSNWDCECAESWQECSTEQGSGWRTDWAQVQNLRQTLLDTWAEDGEILRSLFFSQMFVSGSELNRREGWVRSGRAGGGITQLWVFLTHWALQLCRKKERCEVGINSSSFSGVSVKRCSF